MKVKLNFNIQPQPGDVLIDNKEGTGNMYVVTNDGCLELIPNRKSNTVNLNKGTVFYKVSHALLGDSDISALAYNNTEFTIL